MSRSILMLFLLVSFEVMGQFSIQEQPIQKIEELSKSSDISFDLRGGLILLDAEKNGKKGQYILDTGAPCLIVNKNNEDKESDVKAVGVGGTMSIHESNVERFTLGKFIRNQINCFELDISHIEKLKKVKIAGMIGYDLIKNKELIFDYDNFSLGLLEGGNTEKYKEFSRIKTIPFKMHGHIPIIKVKIGKKKYVFGIDSGAEVNVLNYKAFKKLKTEQYNGIEESSVQSVGSSKMDVVSGDLKKIIVGKESYEDLRFVFTDMESFNAAYGTELDGLLGFPFLNKRLHSIDFYNKQLVIWE